MPFIIRLNANKQQVPEFQFIVIFFTTKKMEFISNLKPAIILATLLGINLDTSKQKSVGLQQRIYRLAITLLGFTNIIINFVRVVETVQHWIKEEITTEDFPSKMHLLFLIGKCISEVGPSVLQMAVQLSLFIHVNFTKKWQKIWSDLKNIQEEFQLDECFYRRVRKRSYIGLLILFVVSIRRYYNVIG